MKTHHLRALLFAASLVAPTLASAQKTKLPPRRPVTPELERSAFADSTARALLLRARAARLEQDSSLQAYESKTYFRMTIGMGLRRTPLDRLLLRTEQSAIVRWSRGAGMLVQPTGRRTVFPFGNAQLDLVEITPVPYFPGREALWIPMANSGAVKAEIDEEDIIHPVASGAEAYYKYATGDSLTITLTDGQKIHIRELRITARRPEWRAVVGSFWFDTDRGNLVRAAYRISEEVDYWRVAMEEHAKEIEDLRRRAVLDTAIRDSLLKVVDDEKLGFWAKAAIKVFEGSFRPAKGNLSAVTIEYGLYGGKFWLPKVNIAQGEMEIGPVRVPVTVEETYRYPLVNAALPAGAIPSLESLGFGVGDTSISVSGQVTIGSGDGPPARDTSFAARMARVDSMSKRYAVRSDSFMRRSDSLRAANDTAKAREAKYMSDYYRNLSRQMARQFSACANDKTGDSSYVAGVSTRYNGALRMAVTLPCDMKKLDESPDLPGSIYGSGDPLLSDAERDELLKSLDLSLQPGWGPTGPHFLTGLSFLRYNRIEGLSVGGAAESNLGFGFSARAVARYGFADGIPNGEFSLTRSNGRTDVTLGWFKRLGVANDDWGSPLGFRASLSNVLHARDEGFYYRTSGVELSGSSSAVGTIGGGSLNWRLFAERQRSAGRDPKTQISLAHALNDVVFGPNIEGDALNALGGDVTMGRVFGIDPRRLSVRGRLRLEGAYTQREDTIGRTAYGRFFADGSATRALGRFRPILSGAIGSSLGDLPAQRGFFVGGRQTVRGQAARVPTAGVVDDAFWLGRAELGIGRVYGFNPVPFYELGWAGKRGDFLSPGRPMSGAGVGFNFFSGLLHFDVARGIYPDTKWRIDLYMGSRY